MRTIYIDSGFKCHIANDGTMTAVETDYFHGKCTEFIEGHCYKIGENSTEIYPWKDYDELKNAQRAYECQLLSEYAEALRTVGVVV